ncbi:MAG TPA: UDP-glucose/GDP-mannose dehydrogenase family protein [Candidatus Limnocylindrales bacterium]|nr:UDP-glucose/GDP-mannose dehydrogenase family protein [Candidatus Limnocylindrales bacterium]
MKIAGVGQGYVGLVTAAGAAEWGHDVVGVEIDPRRLEALQAGSSPIYEPGLAELVGAHVESGRLTFTSDTAAAVASARIVFVAVATTDADGNWDFATMRRCIRGLVPVMDDDSTLVIRSTCPPQLVKELVELVARLRQSAGRAELALAFNPEFTREGNAVHDFLQPDRVVLGIASDPTGAAEAALRQFYAAVESPVLVMDAVDAMLSKLAANLFLATKISFANELAALCDLHGSRVERVVEGMSYDPRIGGSFLRAGIGFGGSCLPHQVKMTVQDADAFGIDVPLLAAVDSINARQRIAFVDRLAGLAHGLDGRRIALLGLTFKPHTDDLRAAPGLDIAADLVARGATVVAYDPMENARHRAAAMIDGLIVVDSAMDAVAGADAIGLVTEWPEFIALPWTEVADVVRGRVIVDGRNALDPEALAEAGFIYSAFGRGETVPVDIEPVTVTHLEPLVEIGRALAVGEAEGGRR